MQVEVTPFDAGAFAALEPVSSGRSYYVSQNGNDRSSGLSESEAFRTLQRAADQTKAGDTVMVMNGVYREGGRGRSVLEISTSGRPGNWIQYRAYQGHTPVIKAKGHHAAVFTNAAYVLIEGFTVEGDAPNISLEYARAEQNKLENPVTHSSGIAAYLRGGRSPHHLIIRNNHVFNCPSSGIFANSADYVRIEDNHVHGNAKYSAYATSGISFYQSRDIDSASGIKMIIQRNTIYDNENLIPFYFSSEVGESERIITDGNGIIIDDGRNSQGFVGKPGQPYRGTTLVTNNLVYGNGGRGVNVYSSDNVVVSYNTSYHNAHTNSSNISAELGLGNSSSVQVYGNIIVARPDRNAISHYGTENMYIDNNLFYGGSAPPAYPPGSAGSNRLADPQFVGTSTDPKTADFRLGDSSPARDAGTTPFPEVDIESKARPVGPAPDLGANERPLLEGTRCSGLRPRRF